MCVTSNYYKRQHDLGRNLNTSLTFVCKAISLFETIALIASDISVMSLDSIFSEMEKSLLSDQVSSKLLVNLKSIEVASPSVIVT